MGQQYKFHKTEICSKDTLTIIHANLKIPPNDTAKSHREIRCTQISNLGIRFDLGFFRAFYDNKTKFWMNNSGGPTMAISIAYRQFNFGIRVKSSTFSPQNNLIFGSDTLTNNFYVNPNKFDYFIGYSLDFIHHISIEPFVALSNNRFPVINESEFDKSFKIPNFNSLKLGFTLNKYFKRKDFIFFTLYLNYGYSFADYSKINNELGKGYHDFTFGISYKLFSPITKSYRVE